MLSKGIIQENKMDVRQFKTATGSPITYTKFRKHKGIYYPLAKTHLNSRRKPKPLAKHVCVVFSKMYGREMYGNIDIWPDEDARQRIKAEREFYKKLHLSEADIPLLETHTDQSTPRESTPQGGYTKSADDITQTNTDNNNHVKKHVTIRVTDTSEDDDTSQEGEQVHPPLEVEHGPGVEDGTWPIKRSQSVDSRDNPFLPGGNLSKEAEEILARATIIRDTFVLKDNEGANTGSNVKDTSGAHAPVEEPMTANVAGSTEASPPSAASGNTAAAPKSNINDVKPKENGQLETDSSLTPVNEKVVDPDKNKKKHQKCCLIM